MENKTATAIKGLGSMLGILEIVGAWDSLYNYVIKGSLFLPRVKGLRLEFIGSRP